MVSWILFPLVGLSLGFLYVWNTSFEQFYPFVFTNMLLVTGIVSVLFFYTKYIARMEFLNVSFGLGDLLFFYAFALGFPTITFLISKGKQEEDTIPLAGLMGFFLIVVTLDDYAGKSTSNFLIEIGLNED